MMIYSAHVDQTQIGFSGIFKGLISTIWGDIQEDDYKRNHRDRKYNRIRWEKKIIDMFQDFATNMWKERCAIVQTANTDTNEIRYCQRMWKYCQDVNTKPWQLKDDSRHLLDRDENYFRTTTLINVQNWYDNVTSAIDRNNRPETDIFGDIRRFFN